jgi:hypothetical protein
MSKYMINKLMWEVERTDHALTAFKRDTSGFIDGWEATQALPPYPEGGKLTPEERTAFEEWDYAALYRLGAHPFLLWQFTRAIWVPERMTEEELATSFREAVSNLGYPDFST